MFGIMRILLNSLVMTLAIAGQAFAQDIQIEPPELVTPEDIAPDITLKPEAGSEVEAEGDTGPDYSDLTEEAERKARLDALFTRLQAETHAENADLIAEEIWAAAQKRGERKLARRMYDNVTGLSPDYAEGYARSARLALEEDDLGRALKEAAQALIYEPRHFYALWTMGNVFEKLSRIKGRQRPSRRDAK